MGILHRGTGIPHYSVRRRNLNPMLVGSILSDALHGLADGRSVPDILQVIFRGLRLPERDIADIKVHRSCDTVHTSLAGVLPSYQRL